MLVSYLQILASLLILTLLIDLLVTKVILRLPLKLAFTVLFIFGSFVFMDYSGVYLKLWGFTEEGLSRIYILTLPIEEYLFMLITPYSAIIIWELFHKVIKKRR